MHPRPSTCPPALVTQAKINDTVDPVGYNALRMKHNNIILGGIFLPLPSFLGIIEVDALRRSRGKKNGCSMGPDRQNVCLSVCASVPKPFDFFFEEYFLGFEN